MTSMNTSELQELLAWKDELAANVDQFFLLTMGLIIYMMQAGFAFVETGAVRSKNATNILIKNALDAFFGGVSYWLFGYAFAFGSGNAFIGHHQFGHNEMPETDYAFWFFQYVFAATAATIVSGAVAERCDFIAYVIYSCCITGFIYPVVTHWAWSGEGWLATGQTYVIDGEEINVAYSDFAGSGVVHMVGGIAAFLGAALLGPRMGRFDKETGMPVDIKGHSVPLSALGGFILVFGFFAFNGSSQGSMSSPGDGAAVAIAIKNTVLAASGGAFTTLLVNKTRWFGDGKWSFLTTLNGSLTGMVAICGGCNQMYSYAAFVVGIGGGVAYMITTWLVLKLGVDDPLDATAVHYGGGVWGVLAVAIFSNDFGIFYNWDQKSGYHLAWQLAGISAIFAWTTVLCVIMFGLLKYLKIFRVPFEYEFKGLDLPKHGEPAYPAEAYGHGWGEKGDTLAGLIKVATSATQKTIAPTASDSDLKINMAEPHRQLENPELEAMRNGHYQQGSNETLASNVTSTTNL